MFLLARIVAGLSEGNIQLSIAIISDITPADQRSRSLVKKKKNTFLFFTGPFMLFAVLQ